MLFLLSLVVRVFARLLSLRVGGHDDGTKDLEILVLRHQLRVLQRTSGQPRLRAIDRVLLSVASRVIPRERWASSSSLRRHSSAGIRARSAGSDRTRDRARDEPTVGPSRSQ